MANDLTVDVDNGSIDVQRGSARSAARRIGIRLRHAVDTYIGVGGVLIILCAYFRSIRTAIASLPTIRLTT